MKATAIYCGRCGAKLAENGDCPYCGDRGFEPDGIAGRIRKLLFSILR